MRSPFAIFRKHQRILMVITIGLSMFIFVICSGAGQSGDNIPKQLIFVAIVCMCGGVAWLIGLPSKKSNETALLGVIIGAVLALLMYRASGPPVAVRAESGNITREQFDSLRRRRELSNQFVSQAVFSTRKETDYQTVLSRYQFGGYADNPTSERDIVTTELLRREAADLGLFATDAAVTDYINEFTENGMTPDMFKDLRKKLGVGEDQLFEILAEELQARMAAEFLYDFDFKEPSRVAPMLTPEQYWEFYRQIWVEQSAEVAAIPVSDFIDESAEPPPEDLQRLFAEYRGNYPNLTKSGELAEGRFGFMQPRKVELAFLEVVFDDVKATIEEPTATEIEAYYQEHYVKPAEERAAAAAAEAAENQNGDNENSALPQLRFDRPEAPESGSPPSAPGSAESPPGDAPATPQPESAGPAAEESPGAGAGTTPSPEGTNGEEPAATDPGDSPGTAGTGIPGALFGGTQFVALQQVPSSEAADDGNPPADDAPAGDDPETPASAAAEETAPSATTDSESAPEGTDGEGASEPAPPESAAPPLTGALREEIRTQIVRERTLKKMDEIASTAMQAFTDLAYAMSLPEKDPNHLTAGQLSTKIAVYAEEHGLFYGTTPRITLNDLQESEEYPIGSADVKGRGNVAVTLDQKNPKDLFRADIAEGVAADSRFVFWKVADDAAEEPRSLNDEGVREQVEKAWRQEQARASARNRAAELLVLIRGADGSMEEGLAGQTTTGDPDADALVVVPTGKFRWLSDPSASRPNPFFSRPQIRDPNGVAGVGPEFMETVFDKMSPGDVDLAANVEHSEFYLVKILERTPWGEDEDVVFRNEFLAQPLFEGFSGFDIGFSFPSVYQRLATAETLRYRHDWVQQLWEKHGARLLVESNG